MRCLPSSIKARPDLVIIRSVLAAPVITRVPVAATWSVHRTRTAGRSRSSEASATVIALRATITARCTVRRSRAGSRPTLIRARSAGAFGSIRSHKPWQVSFRLAVPDAVGASSRLFMAHRLDVGSIAAHEFATRLFAARTPSIGGSPARGRLKSSGAGT